MRAAPQCAQSHANVQSTDSVQNTSQHHGVPHMHRPVVFVFLEAAPKSSQQKRIVSVYGPTVTT